MSEKIENLFANLGWLCNIWISVMCFKSFQIFTFCSIILDLFSSSVAYILLLLVQVSRMNPSISTHSSLLELWLWKRFVRKTISIIVIFLFLKIKINWSFTAFLVDEPFQKKPSIAHRLRMWLLFQLWCLLSFFLREQQKKFLITIFLIDVFFKKKLA